MKVVLDTNVLLISNEIISEYLEIIGKKTTEEIAVNVAELLITLRNVYKVEPYFKWNLIKQDKDDNKFVDCALAGGADYIVTNDKHFNDLREMDFPRIETISADEFLKIITQNDL